MSGEILNDALVIGGGLVAAGGGIHLFAQKLGINVALTHKGRVNYKLRRVFDGAGITTTSVRPQANGPDKIVRSTPRVLRATRNKETGINTLEVKANSGRSSADLVKVAPAVGDALGALEITATPLGRGVVRYTYSRRPGYRDPFGYKELQALLSVLNLGTRVPIGLYDDGRVASINIGHTLVIGATGTGKSAVLWTIAKALKDLGGVKLYGIDPKHSEFAQAGNFFEQVAFEPDEIAALLESVYTSLKARQARGTRTFATLGEDFIVVLIDEVNSILIGADRSTALRIRELLNLILAQGRSSGVYIVAAGQQPQKDTLAGIARSQFQNRICMRVETAEEVKLVLGESAVDKGVRIHELPAATESNGYRTAGVGYVNTDEEPAPARFRAPRITDEDIIGFCNPTQGGEVDV